MDNGVVELGRRSRQSIAHRSRLAWRRTGCRASPRDTARILYRGLEWASEYLADYCDALLAPGADVRLLHALWNAIDEAGGFDVIRLNQVRPDGRVKQLLDDTAAGWGS